MAERKDPVVEEVRKVRRKLSARLLKARREGRLMAELRNVEREGEKVLRELAGGSRTRKQRRAE
jgi:hypothetical protein